MRQGAHRHLHRLRWLYPRQKLYFITTNTHDRWPILASPAVASILIKEWQEAPDRHGWLVGRYVIMPDHVHFFCAPLQDDHSLSRFVGAWKEWTAKQVLKVFCATQAQAGLQATRSSSRVESGAQGPGEYRSRLWQSEFFDHLLRSRESYSEKWDYVWRNPVRAGLVLKAEDWPWQGELYPLQGPDE